ncbi:hypothetical protein [Aliiroseovarius sp.]|uniref:hypothetical protein n=1 Tax=Aliiroseovarius sp. TaxID=1872442 RepID=UPI003BA90EC7
MNAIIAGGAIGLILILAATRGDAWADRVLVLAAWLSVAVSLAALALSIQVKSRWAIGAGLVCLSLLAVGAVVGLLECAMGGLSGGYERYGNCGVDRMVQVALVWVGVCLVLLGRSARVFWPMLAVCLPLALVVVQVFLLAPLHKIIGATDLSNTCFLVGYAEVGDDTGSLRRLQERERPEFGWVVGEHSPRVYRLDEGQADIWWYSTREFVPVATTPILGTACDLQGR